MGPVTFLPHASEVLTNLGALRFFPRRVASNVPQRIFPDYSRGIAITGQRGMVLCQRKTNERVPR